MRGSLGPRDSVDMLSMINKTKTYLGSTANSAYGLKDRRPGNNSPIPEA